MNDQPINKNNNNNEESDISIKDLIAMGDSIDKWQSLLMNKDTSLVIAEFFIKQEMTLKEIREACEQVNPDELEKILERLQKYEILKFENDVYIISLANLQNLFFSVDKFRKSAKTLIDKMIGSQYLFQSILNRELSKLLKKKSINAEQSVKDQFYDNMIDKYHYLNYHFVNKEIFTKYQSMLTPIYKEMVKELMAVDEKENYQKVPPYFIYSGFLYFPELDDD